MARPKAPNPAKEYAEAVASGEILACGWVQLACARHLGDLAEGHKRGLRFDVDLGNRAISFIESLHHYKGKWAKPPPGQRRCSCPGGREECPTRLRLQLWQKFIVANLFGWQRKNDVGRWVRRFRLAYKQVARKNGKSFLEAGIGLYLMAADGEPGAEVYSAATKRDQAKIIFDAAKATTRLTAGLRNAIEGWKSKLGNLYIRDTFAKFEALGADADTLDGLNPHGALIDEFHAHKTRDVLSVLESGMGAREQPLLSVVTTAGVLFDGSPCKAMRDQCVRVLEGVLEDDGLFAYIAELDEGDDWKDSSVYIKANPNLGVSVSLDDLERSALRAAEDPDAENEFKIKNLDLWVGQARRYIPMDKWQACPSPVDAAALRGRKCFAGLDLAANQDLTALSLVFPPEYDDGLWQVLVRYWIPKVMYDFRGRRDRNIQRWAQDGWIEVTGGNETDYVTIRNRIAELSDLYEIRQIGFDPWNAYQLSHQLMGDGFDLVKMPQGYKTLSAPTKRFKALVMGCRIEHEGNPVLSWNLSNLAVRKDPNENVAVDKARSAERIDGAAATILAIGRAIDLPEELPSVYESANYGA